MNKYGLVMLFFGCFFSSESHQLTDRSFTREEIFGAESPITIEMLRFIAKKTYDSKIKQLACYRVQGFEKKDIETVGVYRPEIADIHVFRNVRNNMIYYFSKPMSHTDDNFASFSIVSKNIVVDVKREAHVFGTVEGKPCHVTFDGKEYIAKFFNFIQLEGFVQHE